MPRSFTLALLTLAACGGETDGGGAPDAGSFGRDVGAGADGSARDTGPADPRAAMIADLFGPATPLDPPLVEATEAELVTRFADRGRDRHAREAQFSAYEHYLPLYWEHRTIGVEVRDPIGRGGDTITFEVTTLWELVPMQAELRLFYRGIGTVAEYHDNRPMTPLDPLRYRHEVSLNSAEGRPLEVGDRMELEISQFLLGPPRGRSNYYGTTFLYIVGEGLVPWIGSGPRRDSVPIPSSARLGGATTLHANESNEPEYAFSQMATLTAPEHAQAFMRGRRLAHTDFGDGGHDESPENPVWSEQAGKAGPLSVNPSCSGCHPRNGRAAPPEPGMPLGRHVVKVGGPGGGPDPRFGEVLQPNGPAPGEPDARLARWIEEGALRRPEYAFEGPPPARFSARISPQLVGLGLLEAIAEDDLLALADPEDADGDGISGRAHVVLDRETGMKRLGRFGYKAAQPTLRQQSAIALRTDMGVLSSVYPTPDCGAEQTGCGPEGAELSDEELDALTLYVALLGVPAQRGFDDPEVAAGEAVFEAVGCASCHVGAFTTSAFAPHAELRSQAIRPFTDLLLHDMGPGLADALGEGEASGAEWRTAPLWGVGHTEGVTGAPGYLHDGRARTLEEAIRWHGGEAEASREAYLARPEAERAQLLDFLRSL